MSRLPGRPDIPPIFRTIAMKDRDDPATVWMLQAEPDGDYIKLVTPLPPRFYGQVFEPFDGPWIGDVTRPVRLFVRGGALGYDVPSVKVLTRPAYAPERHRARRGDVFFEVVLPDDFFSGEGVLSYLTGDVV